LAATHTTLPLSSTLTSGLSDRTCNPFNFKKSQPPTPRSTSIVFFPRSISKTASPTSNFVIPTQYEGQILNLNRHDLTLLKRVRGLKELEYGWNLPDSMPASPQAIKDAENFINTIDVQSIPLPYISLSDDGEVNFWWKNGENIVDIGFFGDNTYVLYATINDIESVLEDMSIVKGLPENIFLGLKSF
jgi:hypothetical protein